ncbi:hypothetical protein BH11CYA1_BH11CYA1_06400 [soil metagenome]
MIAAMVNLGLLCCLVFCALQVEHELAEQVKAREIVVACDILSKSLYEAGVAIGGYSITRSEMFAHRFAEISKQVTTSLGELKELVGTNQAKQTVFERIESNARDQLKILTETKASIDSKAADVGQFRARHMYKNVRSSLDDLKQQIRFLIAGPSPDGQAASPGFSAQISTKIILVIGLLFNAIMAFVAVNRLRF